MRTAEDALHAKVANGPKVLFAISAIKDGKLDVIKIDSIEMFKWATAQHMPVGTTPLEAALNTFNESVASIHILAASIGKTVEELLAKSDRGLFELLVPLHNLILELEAEEAEGRPRSFPPSADSGLNSTGD